MKEQRSCLPTNSSSSASGSVVSKGQRLALDLAFKAPATDSGTFFRSCPRSTRTTSARWTTGSFAIDGQVKGELWTWRLPLVLDQCEVSAPPSNVQISRFPHAPCSSISRSQIPAERRQHRGESSTDSTSCFGQHPRRAHAAAPLDLRSRRGRALHWQGDLPTFVAPSSSRGSTSSPAPSPRMPRYGRACRTSQQQYDKVAAAARRRRKCHRERRDAAASARDSTGVARTRSAASAASHSPHRRQQRVGVALARRPAGLRAAG